MEYKICAKCGLEKLSSEFHKNSRNKDGLHSYCKECNKASAKSFNNTEKGKENVKKAQKNQRDSGYFKYGAGAIHNMMNSAEKRGISFLLSKEDLTEWWKTTPDICNYCGITISEYLELRNYIVNYDGSDWEISRFKKFYKLENHIAISDMTIDRVNNSKGYEIDNIVKACWICNSQKSDFYTEEEIKIVGKLIINNLYKKITFNQK